MLLQSPSWKVVEQVIEEIIASERDQSNLRETEWETAKNVALEEGRIQGLRKLTQRLFDLAQNA